MPEKFVEEIKNGVKSRLREFESLPKSEYKKEFMFCLLTPQSKAQKCWQAVEEIDKLPSINLKSVTKILSTKTRFHNTKAKRILSNLPLWSEIEEELKNENVFELRNFLVKNVDGYGLKEASHFLRNIGKSKNQIAILDRHILRNLEKEGIITEQKIKSPKHYLEIERAYLGYAMKINVPADELDLLWWSNENGEIFK